jgi:hypothetical protein
MAAIMTTQQPEAEIVIERLSDYLNARDLYFESFDRGVHEGYRTWLKIQMTNAEHRLLEAFTQLAGR